METLEHLLRESPHRHQCHCHMDHPFYSMLYSGFTKFYMNQGLRFWRLLATNF
ncbi:unnamed protein product [Arabidopsis halleri]